jgi:hypothetical protein
MMESVDASNSPATISFLLRTHELNVSTDSVPVSIFI